MTPIIMIIVIAITIIIIIIIITIIIIIIIITSVINARRPVGGEPEQLAGDVGGHHGVLVHRPRRVPRRGTNGVSTNGATAKFMLFDRGTLWVLTLTYLYLPKSARSYLFPQSVKIYYFCSGPMSVDPVCP